MTVAGEKLVNGFVVNEEILEVEETKEEIGEWMDSEALHPDMVEAGRREEVEFMVKKLEMFEFGDLEEARRRGGKEPTGEAETCRAEVLVGPRSGESWETGSEKSLRRRQSSRPLDETKEPRKHAEKDWLRRRGFNFQVAC